MKTSSAHPTDGAPASAARPARFAVAVAAACLAALTLPGVASANENHPGCNGLYETARFSTAKHRDTHGHETVHHVFEQLGCDHD